MLYGSRTTEHRNISSNWWPCTDSLRNPANSLQRPPTGECGLSGDGNRRQGPFGHPRIRVALHLRRNGIRIVPVVYSPSGCSSRHQPSPHEKISKAFAPACGNDRDQVTHQIQRAQAQANELPCGRLVCCDVPRNKHRDVGKLPAGKQYRGTKQTVPKRQWFAVVGDNAHLSQPLAQRS